MQSFLLHIIEFNGYTQLHFILIFMKYAHCFLSIFFILLLSRKYLSKHILEFCIYNSIIILC